MDIFETIKSIIVEQCAVDENVITEDATMDNIGIDSLDVVEIIMAIEDNYGIKISDEEIEDIETISDLVEIIENHI